MQLLRVERVPRVRQALEIRRERVALLRVHRQVLAVHADVPRTAMEKRSVSWLWEFVEFVFAR